MYAGPKAVFYAMSRSSLLKQLASRYGMATSQSFARRFIAGETAEEAIAAASALQQRGFHLTLDYLGESVASGEEAATAAKEYVRLMDELVASGIERNVSLKLSQLGASVDRATCIDNLRRVLEAADRHAFFVRIDMENSPYTALTLEVFETVWQQGHRNVGVALQACLHRTPGDVVRMNQLGARVRLVKGAYKEPATVAHQRKADVDEAFVTLACGLLDGGTYPAIATHDVAMLDRVKAYAAQQRIDRSRYEFQMLFGVRRDLQDALAADGYRMRIYLPFGRQWFPYFMRRLGERPANLSFVIRSLIHERRAS